MFENFAQGAQLMGQWDVILWIIFGTILGLLLGAVPGLTGTLGIVLLLPVTFGMSPIAGISTLVAIYVGGMSGGLVSATLLGMPGTPASVATTFDAFPMAKKGFPGKALATGVVCSFLGGVLSWLVLVAATPLLASVALKFGPFEFAAVCIFGLVVVAGLSSASMGKAFVAMLLGLLLVTIGFDPVGGIPRFTFGINRLMIGFGVVPIFMGIFVVTEVLTNVEKIDEKYIMGARKYDRLVPPWLELIKNWFNVVRSTAIGVLFGILPGIGGIISNFVCWDIARKSSKTPEEFGQGSIEGIIASETGNNASLSAAFIPLLGLGIPGCTVTAVILAGFTLHGLTPGPILFIENLNLVYAIFLSMLLANVVMLVSQFSGGMWLFIKAMQSPKWALLPIVLAMVAAGTYTISNRIFDVYVALGFGLVGYLMHKSGLPGPPFVLGVVLGPLIEKYLQQSLMVSRGSWLPFVTRPISVFLITLTFLFIIVMIKGQYARRITPASLEKAVEKK